MLRLQPLHEKPQNDEMRAYQLKELQRLVGLPVSTLRALMRAGHVSPQKSGARLCFSFQDLRILRMAGALHAAKIPARKISAALKRLRLEVGLELPLSAMSIGAVGDRITVRNGGSRWESASGQYTLSLEPSFAPASVAALAPPASLVAEKASKHFEAALELDQAGSPEALAAYRACLKEDGEHLEARINLGRLLHERGDLLEAEMLYRGSAANDALLAYNLGVVLEDLGKDVEAIQNYRRTLALDPTFADAHFNLARLYEKTGNSREALRHLLAYRRAVDKT